MLQAEELLHRALDLEPDNDRVKVCVVISLDAGCSLGLLSTRTHAAVYCCKKHAYWLYVSGRTRECEETETETRRCRSRSAAFLTVSVNQCCA